MSVLMSYHRHIDRSRVQFDYLFWRQTDHTFEEEIEALGGRVYWLPRPGMTANFFKEANAFFTEHRGEYPIVHCHPIYASAIFGGLARKQGASHVIQHSHTTRLSGKSLSAARNLVILGLFGRRATDYVACSQAAKKIFFWKKPEQVCLMRNAIDEEKFAFSQARRDALRAELGLGEGTLVLGHVGRFSKEKNHPFLLDVLTQVRKRRPDARLLLVGDGVLFDKIRELSVQKGLAGAVIFAGRQSDVAGYMSAMDLFLLPSVFEGLGIVLVEAQVNGLPCLAADTVTRESNVSGTVTYLPLKNEEDWVDTILEGVESGRNHGANQLAEVGYNIAVEANRITDYYLSLLK